MDLRAGMSKWKTSPALSAQAIELKSPRDAADANWRNVFRQSPLTKASDINHVRQFLRNPLNSWRELADKARESTRIGCSLGTGKGDCHDDAEPLGVADERGHGAEPGFARRLPNLGARSRHHHALTLLSETSAAVHSALTGVSFSQGIGESRGSHGQAEPRPVAAIILSGCRESESSECAIRYSVVAEFAHSSPAASSSRAAVPAN